MSRTFRKGKNNNKCRDGKKNSDFVMHHDIPPILNGIRQSQKEEERDYFRRFGEVKYNQPTKSRGGTW